MAHMNPDVLELDYTESEAEIYVYEELRRQLDDSFHVFHSVTWTGDRNIRGECDFVIFSKDQGFITLEVKGGKIEMVDNTWYSVTRTGERFRIKDPIRQARYAQWAFRDLYKNFFHDHFSGIFTWAVCFPESSFGPDMHHKDLNRYNVLHAGNLSQIRGWTEELFRYTRPRDGEKSLAGKEAENFLSLFHVSMKLPRSILFTLHKQKEALENINQFQDYLLELFDDKNRVGFQGAAGTGKTWIALKKAVRLAERGKETLFLCFSNNLEEYIRGRIGAFKNLRVTTFHTFAISVLAEVIAGPAADCRTEFRRLVREIFRRLPTARQDSFDPEAFEPTPAEVRGLLRRISGIGKGPDFSDIISRYRKEGAICEDLLNILAQLLPCGDCGAFYSSRLPQALLEIFEEYTLRDQFDSILIDEAQYFEENWCDCITYFFKNRQDRIIYIFYDDNQSIFKGTGELPVARLIAHRGLGNYIFHLRHNLRNTQEIHDYAVRVTGHGSTSHSMDIRGLEPEEKRLHSPAEIRRYVGDLLRELVTVHGLSLSAITILCNVPLRDSPFGHFPEVGGFTLSPDGGGGRKNEVAFRTISQFKGLETDLAVVVLDKAAQVGEAHHRITPELLYVAFTRAKYMLYVVWLE